MPAEYQRAADQFDAFLTDVRDACEFGSRHQAFTTAQGVLLAFRRRLPVADAIRFAGVLPALLRALFVSDWDPAEPRRAFTTSEDALLEVRALRALHNFSPDGAIESVAWALRRQVDVVQLQAMLCTLPPGAAEFWATDDGSVGRRAMEWRALGPPRGAGTEGRNP
ncbi:MAG: hypothetical protein MNPFHGCM_00298 [Gemmatimonadaceae bacterium]|nr:hypothetical protein [Gemmatimonadaceae bacterium]